MYCVLEHFVKAVLRACILLKEIYPKKRFVIIRQNGLSLKTLCFYKIVVWDMGYEKRKFTINVKQVLFSWHFTACHFKNQFRNDSPGGHCQNHSDVR